MGRPKNTRLNFWRHVDMREPDECWPWKISVNKDGYGKFCLNCVGHLAHRFAYELMHGKPPQDRKFCVMHLCNNKRCCNPKHLELGTASENTRAAFRDGLMAFGERHKSAKFSDALIEEIRRDPRTPIELSRAYGINAPYISEIKLGRVRKSLGREML